MLFRRVGTNNSSKLLVRSFSSPQPPAVPTPQELAENFDQVQKFRRLQHSSVTPKFMGQDLVPSDKYIEDPKSVRDVQALSGVPHEQFERTVVVGPRKHKTLQSGFRFANQWTVQWKAEYARWSNPLMGWTSTSDPHSGMKLHFDSKEAAIKYVEKQGWKYETLVANGAPVDATNRYPMRTYADNFLPRVVMERVRDEGQEKSPWFNNHKYGASHWFPTLNYHGNGKARQHGDRVESK